MSHSGFFTRSESGCGSRSDSHFVSSASLISSEVRWRMKTGLPRHLMITCSQRISYRSHRSAAVCGDGERHTFLPSGMAAKSISTFACASTSAEADMLTRKSAFRHDYQPLRPLSSPLFPLNIKQHCLNPIAMFTLHCSLRPCRRQQPHSPHHKILKSLIRSLALLAHIVRKTRYFGCRVLIAVLEG